MLKFSQVEPDLGDLETSYRQAFLKSDASQASFVIGLSNIASLALIRSDYGSFQELDFFMLLVARLAVFILSCASVFILVKSTQPRQHDWAVASYMVAGALINLFINSLTSPDYVAYIGVSIVLLNINYFALFSPLLARTTISYLFSVAVIAQVYAAQATGDLGSVVMGMHVLTNLIGTVISAKLYTHRRLSYKAQMEEKELQAELNELANADPLTGIWNRRKFTAEAMLEFDRVQRYQRPLSLILLDIDHLKAINDEHGHLAGDEALRYCVNILKAQIREQDILGRLGGDEFGLLLPETQLSEAVTVAKRIQEAGRNSSIQLNNQASRITFSMGLSELRGQEQAYDDFFERADKMLYRAKESGRDILVFTDADN
jgi:diguanylate cyclase (GGDEF)-like protein